MKIKYEFATETTEIEVSEEWGSILLDLDRREYNVNHKETRRHCSLETFNLDENLFASDYSIENELIEKENQLEKDIEKAKIMYALEQLKPKHKYILIEHFFNNKTIREIAKELGMNESAVSKQFTRAKNNFKNLYKKRPIF